VIIPRGYSRREEDGAVIVARDDALEAVLSAYRAAPVDARSLHGYAARVPGAREMQGRGVAYAITLPGSQIAVVVRHNQHGGMLRSITGDVFAGGGRTEKELLIALGLEKLRIPTPKVVAYALYPAFAGLVRSDVLTEEIHDSQDLGALLLDSAPGSGRRNHGWEATKRLLQRLRTEGIRHHDLNVKNVLLRMTPDTGFEAYLLDVDRVEFGCDRRWAARANWARLRRSIEKWRKTRGAAITDAELASLRHTVPSTL
jgi:hypothetical protein